GRYPECRTATHRRGRPTLFGPPRPAHPAKEARGNDQRPEERHGARHRRTALVRGGVPAREAGQGAGVRAHQAEGRDLREGGLQDRSEEHTSELRHVSNSYAVFCLEKKSNISTNDS